LLTKKLIYEILPTTEQKPFLDCTISGYSSSATPRQAPHAANRTGRIGRRTAAIFENMAVRRGNHRHAKTEISQLDILGKNL